MSESQNNRLQIGKVITLETASKRLAELDGGYCDLRWALRFCLESAVRVCIRLSNPIPTWEGERVTGEACGKCAEIIAERNRLQLEDASEDAMPQLCRNCQMTKPPMMDSVRYLEQRIGERWGTFFLLRGFLQALCEPSIDTFRFRTFCQLDSEDATGYAMFEIVSDYDYELSILMEMDELYNADLLPSDTSKEDFLVIGLKDLFVWVEDFESALKGESSEARQLLPMNDELTGNSTGRRSMQIEALCKTLMGMGYKKNGSGSIEVEVGAGAVVGIRAKCHEEHGNLFPQPKKTGNKRCNTFNDIWKAAKSEKYGKRITVTDSQ